MFSGENCLQPRISRIHTQDQVEPGSVPLNRVICAGDPPTERSPYQAHNSISVTTPKLNFILESFTNGHMIHTSASGDPPTLACSSGTPNYRFPTFLHAQHDARSPHLFDNFFVTPDNSHSEPTNPGSRLSKNFSLSSCCNGSGHPWLRD